MIYQEVIVQLVINCGWAEPLAAAGDE